MTDTEHRIIRFIRADVEILEDDSCKATVELERQGAGIFTATARGPSSRDDQIRAVARATSDALSEAFDVNRVRVRVMSAQMVQPLTRIAVLVTLAVTRGADSETLLGICDATDNLARAAALSVLNATNRYLGRLPEAG